MTRMAKGMLVGAVHLALVMSIGGKLLVDRLMLPRAWAKAAPYDPNLPIRGRYVRLRVQVEPRGIPESGGGARLAVEDGRLIALPDEDESSQYVTTGFLTQPVAFFIPEHVPDPSRRAPGEELWVEVTVPRRGPPRPIRLGVKKAGGEIAPLPLD